ncbi:MAG: sugar transferase [Proteobacteria bacterium]|nr:sugar transferase [Burkholderiales bacterium]
MSAPASRREVALVGLKTWDALIGLGSLAAALALTHHLEPQTSTADQDVQILSFVAGTFMIGWHYILASRGLYDSRRIGSMAKELGEVIIACALATGLLIVELVLLDARAASRLLVLNVFAVLLTLVSLSRLAMRVGLHRLRTNGRNLRFVLIVGTGPRARRLVAAISAAPELGYRIVGFVDDVDLLTDGSRVLGGFDDLPRLLSANVIDEIFVALPIRSLYAQTQQVALEAEKQGVPVMLLPDLFTMQLARTRVGLVGDNPVVRFITGPEIGGRMAVKRALDVLAAASALIALAPVLIVIGLAVRYTSAGPALFRQARVGQTKRPFAMYKFRTMTVDAEKQQASFEAQNEADGAAFKIRNDPRVTPLGRFLRRTSLDELPQLFNVLRGEMSLVGPRPLPLRDVERFREDWQRRRFSVLPGLTCLWQLSGRSNVDFQRWMELDLEYIDNWSLALDMKILLRTVPVVLRREGAY